jgi:hypothetical protein
MVLQVSIKEERHGAKPKSGKRRDAQAVLEGKGDW